MEYPTVSPLRRRNGRQQACEPCRKRKLACDHTFPTCQRCLRRNAPGACVYLVQGRAYVPPVSPATSAGSARVPSRASQAGRAASSPDGVVSPRLEGASGYLGATSFSPFIQETQSSLSMILGPGTSSSSPSGVPEPGQPSRAATELDNATLDIALEVLNSIPEQAVERVLAVGYINPNDGWVRSAGIKMARSMWDTFGLVLKGERRREGLTYMALTLCNNTARPLAEDQVDPDEWLAAFSGPNLRWEALGILFTYWSISASALPEHDAGIDCTHARQQDKKKLIKQFRRGINQCVKLCSVTRSANTLLLYLLYKQGILSSITFGDASMEHWRALGEVAAMATFLGLHVTPKSAMGEVNVSSEVRRRLFATVFNIDKVSAIFTGRPPVLSRRYCSTPLPLDLSDEILLSRDLPTPGALRGRVDENGWNTDNQIYATTILRARTSMAYIRDEILEIALGNGQDDTPENLIRLKNQQNSTFSSFPKVLLYQPGDAKNEAIEAGPLYTKLLVRLEHLQNMLCIERLLGKKCAAIAQQTGAGGGGNVFLRDDRGASAAADLLDISYELVCLTLVFWTHKDRFVGLYNDFEWLVIGYAAPAAGILCTELLRPPTMMTAPKMPAHSSTSAASAGNTTIPPTRSSIIQQLSLLVGFLDWVGPSAPNGDLCSAVKEVIRHVLDQALNPRPAGDPDVSNNPSFSYGRGAASGGVGPGAVGPGASSDGGGGGGDGLLVNLDAVDISGGFNDYFGFDLLDTFEWLRPDDGAVGA